MIQHEKNDPSYDIHTDEGLSRLVSVLDAHKRFKMHQAIWWNTDSPLPLKTATPSTGVFKLAVPIVWRSAPMDILSGMLTQQVNSWHGYPTLEGKVLKDYMTSRKFITDLRRFTPPFTICRDPQVSEARRNANILLGDRPSKTKDIIVSWRSDYADLLFSPIAGTNVYARVIWLDPALKEAPQEVLNWVVYHEFCIIVGPSGAGKTTLLNMLGGMDRCDEGRIVLDGAEVSRFDEKELTAYRRYDVGFVFQFYNLVQNLTALENVELAIEICKHPLDPAETLRSVGLGQRLNNFPAQLSGGEQQRVAIARALAKNPKILLCDEPTGALDYKTGKSVLALLQDTCRKTGRTVIVITHNSALTGMADRIVQVRSGQIISNEVNEHPVPVEEIEW